MSFEKMRIDELEEENADLRREVDAERERADVLIECCEGYEKQLKAAEMKRDAALVKAAKLREALMEARDELQAFCEELHGEDYNNTKINAALAETGGGYE